MASRRFQVIEEATGKVYTATETRELEPATFATEGQGDTYSYTYKLTTGELLEAAGPSRLKSRDGRVFTY